MPSFEVAPDQEARRLALDTSTSWSVSAPAGSGKTGLLTQRILKLLSIVDQPESVLAITFTRKAANEMRTRILESLERAADAKPILSEASGYEIRNHELARLVLKQNEARGWNLLQNPNRLRLQTIDSFCRQLATSLPLESGVSLPPGVVDDAALLYRTAARRTVAYLESSHSVADDLEFLLQHLSIGIEQLLDLLANMLGSRDSWLPIVAQKSLSKTWLEAALNQLLLEKFEDARGAMRPFSRQLEDLLNHALSQGGNLLEAALDVGITQDGMANPTEELKAWQALANFLLQKNKAQALKTVNTNRGFPAGDKRKIEMHELLGIVADDASLIGNLHRIRSLPEPDVSPEQWQLVQALARVLNICAAELRLLEQESGQCDHTEIAIAALRALGNPEHPTSLAERLDYRIQHILVDEFQDTSSTQVKLLECLTAGWQREDGRTLFVVGDAMQSIYEFRKANVELFRRICSRGIQDIELGPLTLVSNFRSRPDLVASVNSIFTAALGLSGSDDQGFTAAVASRAAADSDNLSFGCHATDKEEAEATAEYISNLLARGEKNIAVLVRNRNHLGEILPALRHRGIHWQAQDIDPLKGRMAVLDIDSLTRALCCPGDRVAWLALLRTPWVGLDNADMLTLTELAEQKNLSLLDAIISLESDSSISEPGAAALKRLGNILSSALAHLGQLPLRWLVEQCWRDLGGPQGLLGVADRENVQDYLRLIEEQESGGMISDWEAFDLALSKLYARPTADNLTCVQIMTMHKAKGLEFDHVILPALSKTNSAGGATPLLVWWEREFRDGQLRFLLSPKASRESDNSLYAYLYEEQKERQMAEQLRILYVAMTRARESLRLSASFKFNEDDEPTKPGKNSLLSGVWSAVANDFKKSFSAINDSEPDLLPTRELHFIRRLPAFRESAFSLGQIIHHEADMDGQFNSRYLARCVGDLLHEDMSRLHGRLDDVQLVEDLRSSWPKRLRSRGLTAAMIDQATARLSQAIGLLSQSTTAAWLLRQRKESSAESRYAAAPSPDQLVRRIVDLTFVESGKRWVIDYKTAEPGSTESREEFIGMQLERYREQLAGYEKIFDDYPVVKALYFPLIDELREFD